MTLLNAITNFIKGLKSVVQISGVVHETISTAVAQGIENGINRVMPTIMKFFLIGAIIFTGILLLGIGIGKYAESLFLQPGLGFFLVGIILISVGGLFFFSIRR